MSILFSQIAIASCNSFKNVTNRSRGALAHGRRGEASSGGSQRRAALDDMRRTSCVNDMPSLRLGYFWPTRKDSEPRSRFARTGSTPEKAVTYFLLGASTQALVLTNRPKKKTPLCEVLFFGLPERIRTFDLQSRSLTRYPAVPRVVSESTRIIPYFPRKCKRFLQFLPFFFPRRRKTVDKFRSSLYNYDILFRFAARRSLSERIF